VCRPPGHGRSWQHTYNANIEPGAGQACNHRRLEELAARARIAPDHGYRTTAVETTNVTEHSSGGGRKIDSEFGSDVLIGHSPNAIGAE
jgi:hypothetical protein